MRPRGTLVGVGVLIVLAVAAVVGLSRNAPPVAKKIAAPLVGHPAPPFALKEITGRPLRLASRRGRVTLINFWATWCGPCRTEMPMINRLQAANPTLSALEIDELDSASAVAAYFRRKHLKLVSLLDSGGKVGVEYHIVAQPVTFWLDRQGIIRAIHFGPMSAAYASKELRRLSA